MGKKSFLKATILTLRVSEQLQNKNSHEKTSIHCPHQRTCKMLFVGADDKGKKAGMVSESFDVIPNQFVSIRHYGLVQNNIEITSGPQVEKWANGFENYTFEEIDGATSVTVDLDTAEEFTDYMSEAFPNALKELKEFCEK